jgi:hypothetical protein
MERQSHPERQGPGDQQDQRDKDERLRLERPGVAQPWPARERDHVGQEVERERHHPEQRHRGKIGGDVRGHREQETRRHQRETKPAQPALPADRFALVDPGRCRRARLARSAAPDDHGAAGDGQSERPVPGDPEQPLLVQRQARLDQQRIGQEREHAAEIACAVQEVRVGRRRMAAAREPSLHQRRGGRDREKRQADGPRHQPDQPGDRRPADRRMPIGADRHRQAEAGDREQAEVARDLPARPEAAAETMGIGVAGEQRALEEHHRGVPHDRRTAEQRQRHAREHRLDREHEERAEEHGAGEPRQGRRAVPCACADRKRPLALYDPGSGHSRSPLDPRSGGD